MSPCTEFVRNSRFSINESAVACFRLKYRVLILRARTRTRKRAPKERVTHTRIRSVCHLYNTCVCICTVARTNKRDTPPPRWHRPLITCIPLGVIYIYNITILTHTHTHRHTRARARAFLNPDKSVTIVIFSNPQINKFLRAFVVRTQHTARYYTDPAVSDLLTISNSFFF